jgi:hypothetical protein
LKKKSTKLKTSTEEAIVEEFLDDFLGKEDAHVKCMQKYKKENLWPGDRKQGQLHNLKGDAKHDFQHETPFESRHLAS